VKNGVRNIPLFHDFFWKCWLPETILSIKLMGIFGIKTPEPDIFKNWVGYNVFNKQFPKATFPKTAASAGRIESSF
jgi:hypothetical protein